MGMVGGSGIVELRGNESIEGGVFKMVVEVYLWIDDNDKGLLRNRLFN